MKVKLEIQSTIQCSKDLVKDIEDNIISFIEDLISIPQTFPRINETLTFKTSGIDDNGPWVKTREFRITKIDHNITDRVITFVLFYNNI